MTLKDQAALHATIEGRVQGVGFRAHVSEFAQSLGVKGWVRNKGDDQVEVWAEGSQVDLDKLLAYLRRGPSVAYVTNVQVSYPQPEGKFTEFMVISSIW
ncbi:MAG TPA: acylphosphatase [Anaerolineaceae bacterium]|jgi:acylphosphatase